MDMYHMIPGGLILIPILAFELLFMSFCFRNRKENGAKEFFLICLLFFLHTLAFLLELTAGSSSHRFVWKVGQFVVLTWLPLALLHFSDSYFNLNIDRKSVWYVLFAGSSLTLTLIEITSAHHSFFITDLIHDGAGLLPVSGYTPGVFLFIFFLYELLGGFLYLYHVCIRMNRERSVYRRRGYFLMLVVLIPILSSLFSVSNKQPIPFNFLPVLFFTGMLGPLYLYATGKLFSPVPADARDLLEAFPDGIITLNRNGVILDFNRKAREYISELAEHHVGYSLEEVSRGSATLKSVLDSAAELSGDVLCRVDSVRDGVPLVLETRYHRSQSKEDVSLIMIRDVSGQAEREYELERSFQHLSDENRVKGVVIEVLSHDLRSPLVMMKHLRQLMGTGGLRENQELLDKGGDELDGLIERADSLLGNLEALAGKHDYVIEDISLASVFRSLDDSIRRSAAKKGVICDLHLDRDVWVASHTGMLRSVLKNVIENGIAYSVPQETVEVSVHENTKQVTIEVGNRASVDEEVMRAFQEGRWGVTRKGTAGESGPGLGLLAGRRFMQWMNGDLSISTDETHGTRVTLTLNRSAEKEKEMEST